MPSLSRRIATLLSIPEHQITAALTLFEEGATIPFVARYRKERTGELDEVQLRAISEQQRLLNELDARRRAIEDSIREQGKWTNELSQALARCTKKAELEDLYQPYKKRRKTRADVAREQGLQPLADRILSQPGSGNPFLDGQRYSRPENGIPDADAALKGARDIIAEQLADDPGRRRDMRQTVGQHGAVQTKAKKDADVAKYRDYVDYQERANRIPSHRYLAVCRGEAEGALSVKVRPDVDRSVAMVMRTVRYRRGSPYAGQLELAVEDATKRLLLPAGERAVRAVLKNEADEEAIGVFAVNLEALLLAAPLGPSPVLGVDPGIRTGCKCAMVSNTGTLLDYQTLFLVGRGDKEIPKLVSLLKKYRPKAVAVGNGTGGREAEGRIRAAVRELDFPVLVVSVNESGASVYSASELAGRELPDVDLTVRGAVSIARRLQDPLAELVKVDPKSIGVGQYQHDVDQGKLERRLSAVVESCVNRVGVDLNTASPALLDHVAGIGPKLSQAIVARRESVGPYQNRAELLEVPKLGKKTYEQCAGFLRIRNGTDVLDNSAVHPERYRLVKRMAKDLGVPLAQLIGSDRVRQIRLSNYTDEETGLSTLQDIAAELEKPGRDPREAFATATFREDIQEVSDLYPGLHLQGIVTNVTNFGAFVDIGVHQDGLVHISQLADHFVRDPHQVVRAGQVIQVKVLEVDLKRKRIALSAKSVG